MTLEQKDKIVDWLLTFLLIAIISWLLIWLFSGCFTLSPKTRDIASANKLASENSVEAHRIAQERRTQVGLINVSSETKLSDIAGIVALSLILIFVLYKMLYNWKHSEKGRYLC